MPLSRHSVGTYQKKSSHTSHQGTLSQSSQLAEPLWTDPGQKSGISVCELISTLKKKSAGGEQIVKHSPKFSHTRKKPPPLPPPPRAGIVWDSGKQGDMHVATAD